MMNATEWSDVMINSSVSQHLHYMIKNKVSLLKIRQSIDCGSVRKYETFNLYLGSVAGP